jgi:hypothetical protein
MTSSSQKTVFYTQAFFLHERLLTQHISEADHIKFEEWVSAQGTQMQKDGLRAGRSERIVANMYQGRPVELAVWLMKDRSVGDTELVTLTQRFYFRKVDDKRSAFRAPFSVDNAVSIEGKFSITRCIGDTGVDMLRQSRRITVLGYAQITQIEPSVKIEISPLFIGHVVERPESEGRSMMTFDDGRREVWPSQVDQFKKVVDVPRANADMRKEVSGMSENDVKHYFASIIGEPYIGKDWGGEKSDLYSSRLTIEGVPVSAAFAFKGPGKKGKLTIHGMGKNGDQGLRLFEEPIDIGVVQHYTEIVPAVRNMLEAVSRWRNSRYMVIDGEMTARILSAYGHLKALPTPPVAEPILQEDDLE